LSGRSDKRVFTTLRGLADVILVGARTARAERYHRLRPRPEHAERRAATGQPAAAIVAVVSGRLDLDLDGPLFAGGGAGPTLVFTCATAPAERLSAVRRRAEVLVVGDERVDVGGMVDALTARGLRRVLCEGGPALLGQLVTVGRLDELCLTVSPQLHAGDAPRILTGPAVQGRRLELGHLLEEDGFLFTRYVVLAGEAVAGPGRQP
jgi:riboflavin biosynthesis pyrimidine reductase